MRNLAPYLLAFLAGGSFAWLILPRLGEALALHSLWAVPLGVVLVAGLFAMAPGSKVSKGGGGQPNKRTAGFQEGQP